MTRNTLSLPGCSPSPLASYLKALGLLRLISEQADASCSACWNGDDFLLDSHLDEESIIKFFLEAYQPSPITAPWNGGSGYYPSDNKTAIDTIRTSSIERFSLYRETIKASQQVIHSLGLKEKPDKDAKDKLLLRARNTFPEESLGWLDSVFVMTDEGAKFPPLLGTGGNDGRLEFTNNFMQRLTELFDFNTGLAKPAAEPLLRQALFGGVVKGLQDSPIGQFSPAASGGANATTGFDGKSAVNPWDYILAMEGTLLFAAASMKRLEGRAPGQLAYPFCVQPASAGYGSAASSDAKEARGEIWMPLWSNPSSLTEIKTLFSEGRAWVGKRPAKSGVDFALATASLGVDRGIAAFTRYAFLVRNGLAYFAVTLQRLQVKRDGFSIDLIASCDHWLQRFLRAAKSDTAPAAISRAANRLEAAIFARSSAAQEDNPATARDILIALGECERVISTRDKWCADNYIPPIPPQPARWVKAADDGSTEYRLAASLASMRAFFKGEFFPLRRHLEPVAVHPENAQAWWTDQAPGEVVWKEGPIANVLCDIMKRRLLMAKKSSLDSWPEYARLSAWPCDIAAFIENRIDEKRFAQLLWGLSLVHFTKHSDKSNQPTQPLGAERDEMPSAFYAQLKLCFTSNLPEDKKVPIEPIIFNLAASGNGERASRQALRRLHGSSMPVHHIRIPLSGDASRRSAAALLFPLWDSQIQQIGSLVAPRFFENALPINH